MNDKITVVVVEPTKKPYVKDISNDLKTMQELVGGRIEEYMPFDDEVAIICNEQGKINGLPLNRAIYAPSGDCIDVVNGTFFVCSAKIDDEDFSSLSENQQNDYCKMFEQIDKFRNTPFGPIVEEKTTHNER